MRRANEVVAEKNEQILSKYGQKRLLFYAEILDEIADYYTYKDPEIRLYADRQQLWQDKQQAENGKIMEGQFKDMALLLKKMAKESYDIPPQLEKYKKQIIKRLKENDLCVDEIYVKEYSNCRLEVGVYCYAKQGDYFSTLELVDYLSSITHRKLVPDKDCVSYIHDEPVYIVCREELNYQIFYNVARATKTGEVLSGDNYLVQEYPDGRVLFLLSDGMGSGEEACDDSTLAVELFDKLLEAGVSVREAARQVNDVLCMRTRKLRTASLDICQFNLSSGEGIVLKCGAAPTYLKSGSHVRKIEFQTLPLGIMQGEQGSEKNFFFEEGDMVILVTDGIMDVFDQAWDKRGKDQLFRFIERLDCQKPKDVANQILGMAIKLDEGRIRDDMTVVVGVFAAK
jgi:stage II sporulation protein E